MQCEEAREQFADHVNDSVEEPVRSQIAEHLTTCESCKAELEELKTVWEQLGSVPAAQPDPGARARFDLMTEAYQHGLEQRSGWWFGAWSPRRVAFQFGFAVALLALGVLAAGRFPTAPIPARADAPQNVEIAELRGELSGMRQMVALSLMQRDSANDRLRGVNWSYQLQQPGEEVLAALLDTLMHDSNVNVRLATVDALRQFGDRSVVRKGVVDAIARQESPMVQIALIDLAVDLREKESIAALRQLIRDPKLDGTVRSRAQKGLTELE